jgi:hypothetical protein
MQRTGRTPRFNEFSRTTQATTGRLQEKRPWSSRQFKLSQSVLFATADRDTAERSLWDNNFDRALHPHREIARGIRRSLNINRGNTP